MCPRGFDPTWIDRGDHPCVESRRLNDTARHDPTRWLGGERRARSDHETYTPRAVVLALLVELTNRAEKARENRLVQVRVACHHLVGTELELREALHELTMEILPLPHAHEGQEMLPAPFAQLVARQRSRLLVESAPDIQHRDEVGAWVGEQGMLFAGLLLRVGGALAGILHLQEGSDNEHFGQAMLTRSREQHASQARVHWNTRDLLTQARYAPILVHGLQLLQEPHTIVHQPRVGRIQERKAFGFAQSEGRHS